MLSVGRDDKCQAGKYTVPTVHLRQAVELGGEFGSDRRFFPGGFENVTALDAWDLT